jgi:hypothetical protein
MRVALPLLGSERRHRASPKRRVLRCVARLSPGGAQRRQAFGPYLFYSSTASGWAYLRSSISREWRNDRASSAADLAPSPTARTRATALRDDLRVGGAQRGRQLPHLSPESTQSEAYRSPEIPRRNSRRDQGPAWTPTGVRGRIRAASPNRSDLQRPSCESPAPTGRYGSVQQQRSVARPL